jgi:D-beta-D-heptose 7-phosphate kinase/D-beta-D-heptose 1-phosphate adenosyltransferase
MSNGVLGFDRESIFADTHQPVEKTTAIYGYSGAGDCFAATLAVAVGHGLKLADAAKLAYRAGSRYVLKEHNAPISPLDLYEDKFVHPKDLVDRDFKLVFTNGCFDVLHIGHLHTLKYAKEKGDKLVVAINTDESVKKLNKGPNRPYNTLADRKEILAALECVDFVVDFAEDSPYNIVKLIKPDVLVKGGDYLLDQIKSKELVKEVYVAPLIEGISTTELARKMRQ